MKRFNCKEIESSRLIIRPPKLSDAKLMFYNWASDKEVARFLSWTAHDTVAVTEMIIRLWMYMNDQKQEMNYLIISKETNEPIGSINLSNYDKKSKSIYIGFCLSKNYWGKGIATEAVKAILKYTFSYRIKTVYATIDIRNIASSRVLLKNGFLFDTRKVIWNYHEDDMIPIDVYKISKKDWKKIK